LFAALDASDDRHAECLELLETYPGPVALPSLCLADLSHLLSRLGGHDAEVRLLGDLARGELVLEPLSPADLIRVAELVWGYRDLPLRTVDASVVALAERLDTSAIATLDRRHFAVVRPAHVEAFELLP
jgi:uncharacterized protein